jgi:3-deoxy-D-manno-octulosonic-acid transferase
VFFLYNLTLTIAVLLGLPWFAVKLITTPKYRPGATQRLGFYPETEFRKLEGKETIWVHAVSVGEVIAAIPFVRELRRRHPERKIVVTTVTATGNRTARAMARDADLILFFPFDLRPIVRKAIGRIRPALFILIETEIWPNCIHELHRMGVPSLIVNGRISQASYSGYLKIRFLMKRVLQEITAFSMQTAEDARRIITMGAPEGRVQNSGNIKFDRPAHPLSDEEKARLRRDFRLPESGEILVAGSTHSGEEEPLIDAYLRLKQDVPDLLLILAPRHPERSGEAALLLQQKGLAFQKRSQPEEGKDVLLLDTVGELARLYGIGTVAFVGGSLVPHGGHNILEPAAYGVPVVYGPHMENFPEISKVIREREAGIQCTDGESLAEVLGDLLGTSEKRERLGKAGMAVIEENQGALEKTLTLVHQLLSSHKPGQVA